MKAKTPKKKPSASKPQTAAPKVTNSRPKLPATEGRLAGKTLYIEKIETKKRVKSPSPAKVIITLSNAGENWPENSIVVDFKTSGSDHDLKFQFVAANSNDPYGDAFRKLAKCVADYMSKTGGYDPLHGGYWS